MKKVIPALLLFLVLAVYANTTDSCGTNGRVNNYNDQRDSMEQIHPSEDLGAPYGFGPEALWNQSPPSAP
jgi:hypothetical protein